MSLLKSMISPKQHRRRMNIKTKLQLAFRSGSVERDKEPLFLGVPESRARSYSTNEADRLKQSSPKPSREADMEEQKSALSETAADHMQQSKNSLESATPTSDKNHYRKKPSGAFEYTVQEGDTLVKIAARFDVTPSEMMKINKLLSRTVFVGQTLFIPDSKNTDGSSATSRNASPLPNASGDTNLTSLPSVSDHTTSPLGPAKVTTDEVPDSKPHEQNSEAQKSGREHQQKFLRMPVRRLLDEEVADASSGGSLVKGTLLVTTNVIMFDSDVSDPLVMNRADNQRFNVVVYMEEVKSVALFHDLTPRMFWKQPKEIRAHSPKPETYHSGQKTKKPRQESLLEKDEESENVDPVADSVDCDGGIKHQRASPNKEISEKAPDSSAQHRLSAELEDSSSPHIDNSDKPSSETHILQPTATDADNKSALLDHSIPEQGFEPLHFTDKSPSSTISHPQAVHAQPMLQLSQSPTNIADNHENVAKTNAHVSRFEQSKLTGNKTGFSSVKTDLDGSDNVDSLGDSSGDYEKSPVVRSKSATLVTNNDVTSQVNEHKEEKTPLHVSKSSSGRSSPWSKKAQSMVDKLAFQVSNLSWDTSSNQKNGSPRSRDSSPHSSSSPLRTPAHHISRLINYTSNLFQGPAAADDKADDKDRSSPSPKLQLKSHFTKEDMSRALGPDPRGFLLRSDSRHFVEPPLYLQIRRGVRKNVEILQARAFDHWNTGPILNEYWFVVPRDMGDKLYNFLMTWQPDAYGDEEETQPRGQFFYDVDDVNSLGRPFIKVTAERSASEDLVLSDEHFKETEKSWEILSKEEVYGAEKQQSIHRQDTIDDSSPPELIGPTVLIKPEYFRAILRSLPLSMTVGYNWELVYGTHKHGYSLQNMYQKTEQLEEDEPVLLFIMDTYGVVFGAYLSNSIRQNETFYGTGATFLFTFKPEFKKFSWQRNNNFFIHGTKEFFAVGAGEGVFGLWLDSDLAKGRSYRCATFMNDVLAQEEDFSILQLEVWKFVDSCLC